MESIIPFRFEDEKTLLNKTHPIVRLILPFIFVIPFLIANNIYLIFTLVMITFIFSAITRLPILRIFSRLKNVIPFAILIVIFLPLYIGTTIVYRVELGFFVLNIYKEGLSRAMLLFARIFGATYIFMSFFSSLTYSEFIEALTTFRFPAVLVGSLIIMLHYIPIIASSNKKIIESQELRGKRITNYWEKMKSHAYVIGKSLVSNMERSEKMYESLKMRGFTGKLTFARRKIKVIDILFFVCFVAFTLFLVFFVDLSQFYRGALLLFML